MEKKAYQEDAKPSPYMPHLMPMESGLRDREGPQVGSDDGQ